MKRSAVLLFCGIIVLAGTLHSCKKEGPVPPLIGTFTDTRDNKTYKWVGIGNQIWMAENLKYLPSVVGPGTFSTKPYYYVYDYDGTDVEAAKATSNYTTYGVLYNWPAALNACPTGWHLPTDEEWNELLDYLGANRYNYDGSNRGRRTAKSLATSSGWAFSSKTGAVGNTDYPDKRNLTGFSALPGGCLEIGYFWGIGYRGCWWSSTESNIRYEAWCRCMSYKSTNVILWYHPKVFGLSVRCVKD